jgi:CBS domain-containing protein
MKASTTLHGALGHQPLGNPLHTLIKRPALRCPPETSVSQVVHVMKTEDVGSMLVCDAEDRPLGIFTLYDLLNNVPLEASALDQPISAVMRKGVVTLPPQAPAYEAALMMEQHRIRHVALVTEGRLVGVISERDLFTLQQLGLRAIGGSIRKGGDVEELVRISRDIQALALGMIEHDVGAEQVTRFISTLNDMLTARIIDLEFDGVDLPGVEWCWMAMGSEGRFEQTLYTDQDNGIVFTHPNDIDPESVRQRLLPVTQRINQHLASCGFSLCKGNIMAGNPEWCLSLAEWKNRFATWIHRASAPELLNAAIFFDFRALHGAGRLVDELRDALDGMIKQNRHFLKKMAENALLNRVPLGLFRDFVLESPDGNAPPGIDLKVNGITIFVDGARIFSLAAAVHETSTVRRFEGAAAKMGLAADHIEAWADAFHFIQTLRLQQHFRQIEDGLESSNRLDPYHLNRLDRRFLRESLKQAKDVRALLEKHYRF